jgi:Secretion system C-terminal sorting domain
MIRLIFLLFSFPIFLSAQTIKNAFFIQAEKNLIYINDFKVTTKKEKVFTGYFVSNKISIANSSFSLSHKGTVNLYNSFLIKMDENNQILFSKHYWSASNHVELQSMVLDEENNIYITGYIPADVRENDIMIYPEAKTDKRKFIGLIKYDSKGNLLWYKIFESDFLRNKLAIDDEQNIYIGGIYAVSHTALPTIIDTIKSPVLNNNLGVHDTPLFFAKFDKNGATKFVKYLGEGAYDFTGMNDMQFDKVKKVVYSTGYFSGRVIFGKDTLQAPGKYSSHYFLCQMDKAGKFNWATQALSASSDGRGLCTDTKGAVYVAGNYRGERISISNVLNSSNSLGASASFIAKYNENGQVSWIRHLDSYGVGLVDTYDIKIDQSSNLWVSGSFRGNRMVVGEKTFQNESLKQGLVNDIPPDSDIFIAKYNTAGEVLDAFHFGGKGSEAATKILPSPDKSSIYFSGYFHNNPSWKLGNFEFEAPYYNSFFCEMKENIVGIQEVEKAKMNFKVYPNPASHTARVYFEAQAGKHYNLFVTDVFGNIVRKYQPESPTLTVDADNILSGMYFLHLLEDNVKVSTQKLLIQH